MSQSTSSTNANTSEPTEQDLVTKFPYWHRRRRRGEDLAKCCVADIEFYATLGYLIKPPNATRPSQTHTAQKIFQKLMKSVKWCMTENYHDDGTLKYRNGENGDREFTVIGRAFSESATHLLALLVAIQDIHIRGTNPDLLMESFSVRSRDREVTDDETAIRRLQHAAQFSRQYFAPVAKVILDEPWKFDSNLSISERKKAFDSDPKIRNLVMSRQEFTDLNEAIQTHLANPEEALQSTLDYLDVDELRHWIVERAKVLDTVLFWSDALPDL